jgi:hypothetical protein
LASFGAVTCSIRNSRIAHLLASSEAFVSAFSGRILVGWRAGFKVNLLGVAVSRVAAPAPEARELAQPSTRQTWLTCPPPLGVLSGIEAITPPGRYFAEFRDDLPGIF